MQTENGPQRGAGMLDGTMSPPLGEQAIASATHLALAAVLALAMLVLTTSLHHRSLRTIQRRFEASRASRPIAAWVLVALVAVHLAEIGLYAGAYALGAYHLGLGQLRGPGGGAALDLFYFAAETYSTLGYGDIVPLGALRLLASVESLNGAMLLAWSGAFLFGVVDRHGPDGT